MTPRRTTALLLVVALAALAGCAAPRPPAAVDAAQLVPGVVVGATPSPASQVLAQTYALALGARGLRTTVRDDLADRAAALAGLQDQSLSVVPDYLGELALELDPATSVSSAGRLRRAVRDKLPVGLVTGPTSRATGEAFYAASPAFADDQDMNSLRDLDDVDKTVIVGGPRGWAGSAFAAAGLEKTYDAGRLRIDTVDDTQQRLAELEAGKLDVAYFGPDDVVPASADVVRLKDPDKLVPVQNVVPVLRSGVATDGAVVDTLSAVQSSLTSKDLRTMVREVAQNRSAAEVAGSWLSEHGLDRPSPVTPKRVVFIGDSYTHGVGASERSRRWTTLLAQREGWREINLGLGGTGYYNQAGPSGCGRKLCPNYVGLVKVAAAQQPAVVVVAGGQNDFGKLVKNPAGVRAAVDKTYESLRTRFPEAEIVAVGPSTPSEVTSTVTGLDAEVQRAARRVGARYVSLLQPTPAFPPGAVLKDGAHVDDAGHRAIAERVEEGLG